jgi:hypothetical protein
LEHILLTVVHQAGGVCGCLTKADAQLSAVVTNSQGVTRRTEWCKQRHAAIMKAGEAAPAEQQQQQPMLGPDGQPLDAAAGGNIASLATLTKQQVCVNCEGITYTTRYTGSVFLWERRVVTKWCLGVLSQ